MAMMLPAKMDNRGMTYMLVSSLLVVVLVGIFFASKQYTYQDRTDLYEMKIRSMNDFVRSFDSDIHRATHVSAFRAMIALEDHVANSGEFLENASASFKETFYNGTINGTPVEIMVNSSFDDYIQKVQYLADTNGISLDSQIKNIFLTQSDPWSIDVNILMSINISDRKNRVGWIIDKEFKTNVPIENLRDPLYGVYTLNKLPNTIRRCNDTELVTADNDTKNLRTCINESSYMQSEYAPSFIMRFEGNLSPDPSGNGIESIVNVPTLYLQDLPVDWDAIKVDYMYFGNSTASKICDVQNIDPESYFVLASDRASMYQIGGLNYSTICP